MKTIMLCLLGVSTVALFAFTNKQLPVAHSAGILSLWQDTVPYHHYDPNRVYLDPNTGDSVQIFMDESTHKLRNRRNNNNVVSIYVDPVTADTLYGEGYVINNMVTRMPNGKYMVDSTKVKIEGNKIKYKEGSSKGKVKVTDDMIKAKDGHDKTKMSTKGDSLHVKKG